MSATTAFVDALAGLDRSELGAHAGLRRALRGSGLGPPEAILHPSDTAQTAEVMRSASEHGFGVLPFTSGAHREPARPSAATSPNRPWLGLCTDRLRGIEVYEAADLTLTAGAGTSMEEIDTALRANGQWAPFDPPHARDRSLGGLVADGGFGPLATGYGELRNHVLGMTAVTGDGRVLRLGGRVVKNVAGFDLVRAVTGSRGSLAILTSVTVRAFPLPAVDLVLSLRAARLEELLEAAARVRTAPVLPASCLLYERPDGEGEGAVLLVRLHGAASTVDADRTRLAAHLGRPLDVVAADRAAAAVVHARDAAWGRAVRLELSARPSRLSPLLGIVRAMDPVELALDPFTGRLRVGLEAVEADTVETLSASVEAAGGALRVSAAPSPGVVGMGTTLSEDEARLTDDLRRAFDPRGVLWPAYA